jgi:hypothetical protein
VIEESHPTGLWLEGERAKLTICCVTLLPGPFLAASGGQKDSMMPDHELVW